MTLIVLIQENSTVENEVESKGMDSVDKPTQDSTLLYKPTQDSTLLYKQYQRKPEMEEVMKVPCYASPVIRRSNSLGEVSLPTDHSRLLSAEPPRTPIPCNNQRRQISSDQSIYTEDYFGTSTESLNSNCSNSGGARPKTLLSKDMSVSSTCLGDTNASIAYSTHQTINFDICQIYRDDSCEDLHETIPSLEYDNQQRRDTDDILSSADSMFSDTLQDSNNKDTSPTNNSSEKDVDEPVLSEHHNARKEKHYKHKIRKSEERKFDEENYEEGLLRKEYIKKQREERRRRRRFSSKSSRKNSNRNDILDLETNSLLHPDYYGYSLSYTSISELQNVDISDEEYETSTCHVYTGIFLAILSGVLFTANNFILVHFHIAPIDATLVRGFVHCVILGLILRNEVWCPKIVLVLLQGIVGALGLTCALYCVTLMPVPDALTILFTSPLPTFILAVLFMGEKPSILKVVAMISLLCGVILVCKPSFLFPHHQVNTEGYSTNAYIGLILAILSSIFAGVTNVIASYAKDVKNCVIVFWVAISGLVISSGLQFVVPGCKILTLHGSQYSTVQWIVLFGLAFSGLAAYLSMVKSLQIISPTLVATLRSLEIVLAFGIQSAIDMSPPEPISSSGAFLVCFGICMSGVGTWISRPSRQGYQQID